MYAGMTTGVRMMERRCDRMEHQILNPQALSRLLWWILISGRQQCLWAPAQVTQLRRNLDLLWASLSDSGNGCGTTCAFLCLLVSGHRMERTSFKSSLKPPWWEIVTFWAFLMTLYSFRLSGVTDYWGMLFFSFKLKDKQWLMLHNFGAPDFDLGCCLLLANRKRMLEMSCVLHNENILWM